MRVVTIGNATLYHGEALDVLDQLSRTPIVDAVITDPPYSSGGQFRSDRTQDTKAKYVQSSSGNQDALQNFSGDNRDQRSFHFWSTLWAARALAACKPGAVACFFTDWRQLPISTDYLQAGGWVWRGVVPWAKIGSRPQMGRFGAACEFVVWGSAGPMPTERGVGCLPGFFQYGSPREREHVAQKPIELMADIVRIVPPGGVVLDPFMGSGTTGAAAVANGYQFIGVEQDAHSFEVACRRIEEAQAQAMRALPTMPMEQPELLA